MVAKLWSNTLDWLIIRFEECRWRAAVLLTKWEVHRRDKKWRAELRREILSLSAQMQRSQAQKREAERVR